AQILDPAAAPNIARLARTYGDASQFFAEVHPSEGNYVALLGGDTFGIHDDDAFYCKPGMDDPRCAGAKGAGYQDHTSSKPHLGDQLLNAGLTWKGSYESLPEPGSLAVTASDPAYDNGTRKTALYASKHSGFVNFASTRKASDRAEHLVGFDRLYADIAGDRLPSFALIVPNQCNEMHGLSGANIPADCQSGNRAGLIARGDLQLRRRPYPHRGDHQPRTPRPERPHALQPLLAAAHPRGRLPPARAPRPRRGRGQGRGG